MMKSRKGQEGFTLIELLVVVLIIGILAAIAIPAFLGQKTGAQDSNAKSLLRNAAIAMESHYTEHQDFTGATATTMADIEANIDWSPADVAGADAGEDQVHLGVGTPAGGYTLSTNSKSGHLFAYERDADAQVTKTCATGTASKACGNANW